MELILNDLSLNGQFISLDEFEEYYVHDLKKMIDFVMKERICLYKKSDTYSRMITKNISLAAYLRESVNQTVATMIKKAIVDLAYCEPYWDTEDVKTRSDINYDYPNKQKEPNCFTEAIERKCPLISIKQDNNEDFILVCYREEKMVEIANITNYKILLDEYLIDDIENVEVIIENYLNEKEIECAKINGKCYTKEALLNNNLKVQDIQKFIHNMNNLIRDKSEGRKSHWWDNINDNICEYRLSISDGRELRVLFLGEEKLTFLNGFIKKTQKTPENEIKLAERIMNQWK